MIFNENRLTGSDIYEEDINDGIDNPATLMKMQAYSDYIYKSIAPNLSPDNYGWNSLSNSINKKPDWAGRLETVPAAVGKNILGIKIKTLNVQIETLARLKELYTRKEKIESRIRSITNDKSKTEEDRKKEIDKLERTRDAVAALREEIRNTTFNE
jgi:hypothetical protein